MGKKKPEDKLAQKRETLIERTALSLNVSQAEAIELLRIGRHQGIRLNPLKREQTEYTKSELDFVITLGEEYSWAPNCYPIVQSVDYLSELQLFGEGLAYIQNAASWLPVIALDPQPGDAILDVCAAPGGKTSHIAAVTGNKALITANDNSRPRLAKLRANLDRLGVQNVQTTLYDATQIGRKLEGEQFDRILLDAPCSGEGMMQLDRDKDFTTWSVAHIKRLQQLQKRILTQAWQLLKPGGTLVYSTCTMAPEENEAVVDYLLRSQEDAAIAPINLKLENRVPAVKEWNGKAFRPEVEGCMRLKPSQHIEAFFVCRLTKKAVHEH